MGAGAPPYTGGSISDGEAIDLVDSRVDTRITPVERRPQVELAMRCMSYYAGKQWFSQYGGRLVDLEDEYEHKVHYKANRLRQEVDRAHTKVMSVRGTFQVAPLSSTRAHRHSAKISERIFDHLREKLRYEDAKSDALRWAAICGTSYLKITWDPWAGQPEIYHHTPGNRDDLIVPSSDSERRALEQEGYFHQSFPGEVKIEVVAPFAVYTPWETRTGRIEDCEWIAQVQLMTPESLNDLYPGKGALDLNTAEPGLDNALHYEEAIAFMTSASGIFIQDYSTPEQIRGRRVLVKEYWERPRKHNNWMGRYIVIAGGQVMVNRENKYRATQFPLPFVPVHWGRMPGRWWAPSLAEDLMEPQHQYNRARSKLIEFQDVYGFPLVAFPEAWGVDVEAYQTRPGQAVLKPLNSTEKMDIGPLPQMPAEVAANASACANEISYIASAGSPETTLPGQIRSGAGLEMLLGERDVPIADIQRRLLAVDRACGQMMLATAKAFYNERRVLHYLGDDNILRVEFFFASDINHDLRIVGDPFSHKTALARDQRILDIAQAGIFDLPHERQTEVLKALHFHTDEEAVRRRIQGEENQEREIQEIIADPLKYMPREDGTGGYPVEEWEPHADHERVLRFFMQSDEFRALPPHTRIVLAFHWKAHNQELQKAIEQQLALMEASKGTGGTPGRASQPKRGA